MPHVYIRSAASGANNGTSKTDAYTTLSAAYSGSAAGDNFWVASDHAQTQASALTLASPGTLVSPCTVMCVDFAGSTPPVSADLRTTATITTTGANAITIAKTTHYDGITINGGTGAVTSGITIGDGSVPHHITFKNCALRKLGTTGDSNAIKLDGHTYAIFDNTQCQFGAASDAITLGPGCRLKWTNTSAPVAGTFPTILFYNFSGNDVWCEAVDFSAAGFSGKTLFGSSTVTVNNWHLVGCKTHASLTVAQTPQSYGMGSIIIINSDSAGTNYRHSKHGYAGSHVVETTIVRTGGASDGVTPISWAINTTANAQWLAPFVTLPMSIKNNTIGSTVTVPVYGVWGGGVVPTNREIWPIISYMGSSGSPIHTIVSGGAADYLAAATNWSTDASVWGSGTTVFKMVVTLSSPAPAQIGPIYVEIAAAKPSEWFYIDPAIVLT